MILVLLLSHVMDKYSVRSPISLSVLIPSLPTRPFLLAMLGYLHILILKLFNTITFAINFNNFPTCQGRRFTYHGQETSSSPHNYLWAVRRLADEAGKQMDH